MKRNKIALVAMVSAFLVGFTPGVWAEGSGAGDYIKHRAYIGGFLNSMTIDSNSPFDGNFGHFYSPSLGYESNLIPGIDRNFGFGALAGYREGAYAFEISYWQSQHTATWFGLTTPASYHSINVDLKRYFFTQVPTQPFFGLGITFPWLIVKDGSAIGPYVSNETLSGIGWQITVGMELYVTPDFSVVGAAVQNWNGFNQVVGFSGQASKFYVDGNSSHVTNLEARSLEFYVGGTMGFQ